MNVAPPLCSSLFGSSVGTQPVVFARVDGMNSTLLPVYNAECYPPEVSRPLTIPENPRVGGSADEYGTPQPVPRNFKSAEKVGPM